MKRAGFLTAWPGEATPVGPSDLKDIEKGGDLEGKRLRLAPPAGGGGGGGGGGGSGGCDA